MLFMRSSTWFHDASWELEFPRTIVHWMQGPSRAFEKDVVVVVKCNAEGHFQVVIQRDAHELTADDKKKHHAKTQQAILDEIVRLTGHGALQRMRKTDAKNLTDIRWVIRWKFENEELCIRVGLCVYGLKDLDAWVACSTTASRYGQRHICITAAIEKWPIWQADVGQALLRGITLGQISKLTGEPIRKI